MVDGSVGGALWDALRISALFEDGRPVVIVDSFLLFHDPRTRDFSDVKLLLRASRQRAREKGFEKRVYVIPGGGEFWQTEEYFDKVVSPHSVKKHESLFDHGDVEARPLRRACEKLEIAMQPILDGSVEGTLGWAVDVIVGSEQT